MMASPSNSNAPLESAEIEQIITEIFAKSLHIILEARASHTASQNSYSGDTCASSPSSSSSVSSIRPRDKWFNLALRECPDALENLELWRQSNLELLVVDVILTHRQLNRGLDLNLPSAIGSLHQTSLAKDICPTAYSSEKDGFLSIVKEKIVERWIVQYENHRTGFPGRDSSSGSRKHAGSSSSAEMSSFCKKVYRRSILLMRSLYATLRLLPAYKVHSDLCSSSRIQPFRLEHRISSFCEPFSRVEDAEMDQFAFAPIETPCGRLSISVLYLRTLDEMCSEPSTPISAQFIPDYVDSPLAEPVKRFPSFPISESAPSKISFTRRHSWSCDPSSTAYVSLVPSMSQALHDHHGLSPHSHANLDKISSKQQIFRNISLPHAKSTGIEDCCPSTLVSPASPLPPNSNDFKDPLRTVSSPVGIPLVGKARGLSNHTLPPPSPKSATQRNRNARDMGYNISSSADTKSQKKQDKASSGNLQVVAAFQKVFPCGKDDTGSATLSSTTGMPMPTNLKGSSSREYDDSDFTCPFAIEDEDIWIGRQIHDNETMRSGALQLPQKSKHAVVGSLVRMLREAPPLRSNTSRTSHIPQSPNLNERVHFSKSFESASSTLKLAREQQGVASSALLRSKTTVDALAELKNYKDMKDFLLSDGGHNSSVQDSESDLQQPTFGGSS